MDEDIRGLIRQIFEACAELTARTGRPVSPDGHLVGSIGEALAAELLDLQLMPPSTKGFDAVDRQGRRVEIKCTTRRSIALSGHGTEAERLIVIRLDATGSATIVYDGPSAHAWELAGIKQANGQRSLSLSKLMSHQINPLDMPGRT